eukprot:CAMPEP_0204831928 /NCGR_PEP_ID=MMETSP1346-20131115/12145_1 /ASSEMBLY_ACC=CAM_ASM_000771 /TAXON_ID=215587 /ORGANISM="Aplanochytrium stocchinoi, Strain GSBS06" /LENGTH=375 /DNA_ID=CAMNT_0051963381 /DNA_START=195 /DNA_END=1322 /DNA_ORIENTATION=+
MAKAVQELDWKALSAFEKGTLPESDLNILMEQIKLAYGPGGLGILTVSGIEEYAEARRRLLPLARDFALLPADIKEKYQDPESTFQFGWSHGVEILQNGKADTFKGSYYANPKIDVPSTNPEELKRYPTYARPNVWPTEDLPDLRDAFMNLGKIIIKAGEVLAKLCDYYVTSRGLPSPSLSETVKTSPCPKARLLHYFPTTNLKTENDSGSDSDSDSEANESNWCGVHCDHGTLTGLCRAMYINENGEVVKNTNPNVGLYILDSQGKETKVNIPEDSLGFQLGQAAQIHSSGVLRATPHYVKAAAGSSYSRNTFAVFLQPHWDTAMDSAVDPYTFGISEKQWKPNMNFGEFTEATIKYFYSTDSEEPMEFGKSQL